MQLHCVSAEVRRSSASSPERLECYQLFELSIVHRENSSDEAKRLSKANFAPNSWTVSSLTCLFIHQIFSAFCAERFVAFEFCLPRNSGGYCSAALSADGHGLSQKTELDAAQWSPLSGHCSPDAFTSAEGRWIPNRSASEADSENC